MNKIIELNNLCGIDVGCSKIKMSAFYNNSCYYDSVPSGDNITREQLIDVISNFYQSFNCDFDGLGIAFSGCTLNSKTVYHSPLKCMNGLNVSDFSHLHCKKVRFINDANATALSGTLEYPDSKVLLGITSGTGIGLGIVINGSLFCGSNKLAGEIYGNPTLLFNGEITKTGRICSGSKILNKIYYSRQPKDLVLEESAKYLGMELVSLIHILNPDIIYLSGEGFTYSDFIFELNNFVYKHAYPCFTQNLRIVLSSFSKNSGCFGAMKYLRTN